MKLITYNEGITVAEAYQIGYYSECNCDSSYAVVTAAVDSVLAANRQISAMEGFVARVLETTLHAVVYLEDDRTRDMLSVVKKMTNGAVIWDKAFTVLYDSHNDYYAVVLLFSNEESLALFKLAVE